MVGVSIDRTLGESLTNQVYKQLRSNILTGKLPQGMRLPSTRNLAASLEISRNIVIEVYDQLSVEGFVTSRHGSGTYVLTEAHLQENYKLLFDRPRPLAIKSATEIDFRTGVPALDHIPRKRIAKIMRDICLEIPDLAFDYADVAGCLELRQILCHYLFRTRKVQCVPEQIIITSGAVQGIYLITNLLLTPGDEVIIEDPVHYSIRNLFLSFAPRLSYIPVDTFGIDTTQIPAAAKPRLIFITPSHQYPLGGILPIQRRIDLIHLADKSSGYIIEDDYDGDFRFGGSPISSLQGLSPDRVIYLGTFSKILSPALRIGYLVLPDPLVKPCRELKMIIDRHTPTLEQLMLARLINEGHLEKHVMQMKKLYHKRQTFLIQRLAEHFGSNVRISGNSTGLHLIAEFDNIIFDNEIVARLREAGVLIYPVEPHAENKKRHRSKIVLGYSNLSEAQIETGILRLKQVLG